MKKIVALLMTLILALSLAACAAKAEAPAETEAAAETTAEVVETVAETVAETEPASPQIKGDEPAIGAWLLQIDGDAFVEVFKEDGSGYGIALADEKEIRLIDNTTFTWSNNADGSFSCEFQGGENISLTYDAQADTMSAGDIIYTRLDAITGIWTGETKEDDGTITKLTHTLKIDGTGRITRLYDDGTTSASDYCWKKNTDGTYTLSYFDNDISYVWTIADDGRTSTSSSGRTFTKRYDDTYYYLSILGAWYNEKTEAVNTFCGDGTGKRYHKDGVLDFKWEIPEFGQFKITYTSGDLEGQECMWTYDRENNVFTTDSLTGESYTLVRPHGEIDGVTHTAIDKDAYIGQWRTTDETEDGKIEEHIYTVKADGTAYYMALGDDIGIQLTEIVTDAWEKTGDNKYKVTVEDGRILKHTYDAASDTITADSGRVFTRLDPIVGIWSMISPYSSNGTNKYSTTNIVKTDGTGLFARAAQDGTVKCDAFTWNKNADGTYAIKYGNGAETVYTLDFTGYTLKSSSGGTKKKEFLDKCFLMSVTGAWYNEEIGTAAVFNADGTGFLNEGDGSLLKFNWELGEIGKFNITYTSGEWTDNSDATGKETVWTYDRERNVFTSSLGYEYTRVKDSVEGKIEIVGK